MCLGFINFCKCNILPHEIIRFISFQFVNTDAWGSKEIASHGRHQLVHNEYLVAPALYGLPVAYLVPEHALVSVGALDIRVFSIAHAVTVALLAAKVPTEGLSVPTILGFRVLQTLVTGETRGVTTGVS